MRGTVHWQNSNRRQRHGFEPERVPITPGVPLAPRSVGHGYILQSMIFTELNRIVGYQYGSIPQLTEPSAGTVLCGAVQKPLPATG